MLFDRTLKRGLKKQVHLLQEAIKKIKNRKKRKEENRLEYKRRGFVVALQDPAEAISGLTDRSGAPDAAFMKFSFASLLQV